MFRRAWPNTSPISAMMPGRSSVSTTISMGTRPLYWSRSGEGGAGVDEAEGIAEGVRGVEAPLPPWAPGDLARGRLTMDRALGERAQILRAPMNGFEVADREVEIVGRRARILAPRLEQREDDVAAVEVVARRALDTAAAPPKERPRRTGRGWQVWDLDDHAADARGPSSRTTLRRRPCTPTAPDRS